MYELIKAMPDADVLLAPESEELAGRILMLLRLRSDPMFHARNEVNWIDNQNIGQAAYDRQYYEPVRQAIAEAFAWLEAQVLIVPASGTNGSTGWRLLSRRGRAMESAGDFASYRLARLLPRELLHNRIAQPVWLAFARGKYDVAAFLAMKAVEVRVREAAGFGANKIGKVLMQGCVLAGARAFYRYVSRNGGTAGPHEPLRRRDLLVQESALSSRCQP